MAQGGPSVDFITICYRTELSMLRLQARSMARFLDPEGVGRILVIANDEDEKACIAGFETIRADWGRYADRVEFVRGTSLMPRRFRGPLDRLERLWVAGPRCRWRHLRDRAMGKPSYVYGWGLNSGWLMQQAFKLYAATGGGDAGWETRFAAIEEPWIYRLSATEPGMLSRELAERKGQPEPILALHRKWFFKIGATDRTALARYLTARGLLENEAELGAFVAS